MAKVSVSLARTMNLGNFESFKMDFGVEDEQRDGESVGEAHERLFNFVLNRLNKKVELVEREIEEAKNAGGY